MLATTALAGSVRPRNPETTVPIPGKTTGHIGLGKHHARLAVGAAATLAGFLFDCHQGAE
jgi:hypothetical protein